MAVCNQKRLSHIPAHFQWGLRTSRVTAKYSMVGLICKERYGSAILSSDYLPAGPIAQVGRSLDARNGEVRFF